MEKKLTNKNRENTIYLSENEARALGVVEGDTQSIFIDGKKVDLVFVDEHEIFDATIEEKRILNNALNLRKRELAEKMGLVSPDSRTTSLVPYSIINDDTPEIDHLQVSSRGKGFFDSVKSFFGKKHAPNNTQAKHILERNKYRNRTDIFTDEEIDIIQEVISRVHGDDAQKHTTAKTNASSTVKNKVTSPKKKQARRNAKKGKK